MSSGTPASIPATSTTLNAVVCVFCGASCGTSPVHLEAASALAHALHASKATLVYGGGTTGLMGRIASTLVSLSGPDSVQGIIPEALIKHEQQNRPSNTDPSTSTSSTSDLSKAPHSIDESVFGRMTVVKDMHTRKHAMASKVMTGGPGSGFVALSGGFGTLEEFTEVVTWNQLGIHALGCVLFNVDHQWDGLLQWVRTQVSEGFISPPNAGIIVEALTAEDVVQQLREYRPSDSRLNLDWSQK